MEIDFTPYHRLNDDGCIWWPLIDAVKLGAGYLPVRDDDKNLVSTLCANSNRVLANERTLLSLLNPKRWSAAHPRVLVRDNTRYLDGGDVVPELVCHLSPGSAGRRDALPGGAGRSGAARNGKG